MSTEVTKAIVESGVNVAKQAAESTSNLGSNLLAASHNTITNIQNSSSVQNLGSALDRFSTKYITGQGAKDTLIEGHSH